jgi:hypothetical protein
MEMPLLAHRVALELTLSTQQPRIWLECTNHTKRGLGRATKAWSLLEMAWDLSNITRNSNPHLKK